MKKKVAKPFQALSPIKRDLVQSHSTIITFQLPVVQWYEVIGEQTIADAIHDIIVHDACRLELKGESLRKRKKNIFDEELENE